MITYKLHLRFLAVVFALATALGLASHANAYDVYRRVAAHPGNGAVVWNAANFGVGGHPPTLSFFHFANDPAALVAMPAAQCFVKVDLPATGPAPILGATDTVGVLGLGFVANPADHAQPFLWTIDFDNNPANHWSIAKAQMTAAASNNAASRVAAAGLHTLALTPGAHVTVVNGTLGNCHA